MTSHVWRPLIVVIGIVVIILAARMVYVPKDFGAHERGYMYGWHRKSNEDDWKKVVVKYQGADYCANCHPDKAEKIQQTPHGIIQCESCHGPAGTADGALHPDDRLPKLAIDRSREQCLRCHYPLKYPTSGRSQIRGVDPDTHNPGVECSSCHNPHKPMEGLR